MNLRRVWDLVKREKEKRKLGEFSVDCFRISISKGESVSDFLRFNLLGLRARSVHGSSRRLKGRAWISSRNMSVIGTGSCCGQEESWEEQFSKKRCQRLEDYGIRNLHQMSTRGKDSKSELSISSSKRTSSSPSLLLLLTVFDVDSSPFRPRRLRRS